MFEVFTNSIVFPKNLINYHNKKGGFVFLYILFLVTLMSLATIVFFISHKPQAINEENTGCTIVDNYLVCTGDAYDINNRFDMYDFDIHFLSDTDDIASVTNRDVFTIILQGSYLTVFVGESEVNSFNFLKTYDINSLEEVTSILKNSVITAGIFIGLISNTFIIVFIILISTIPFMRFRQLISYKKIFKMLTFAATPMAFLFAIYNLVNFDTIIFFILMLFAYRSVFVLQREIQIRVINRSGGGSNTYGKDDSNDTEENSPETEDDDEIDSENDDQEQ